MIENDGQLRQEYEALGDLYQALASYRAKVLPLNPRNYAVMAQGPLEEIRKIQGEIDAYLSRNIWRKTACDNSRLAPQSSARHRGGMKTASVQQWPQQWPEILRWVAAGEDVQVTEQNKVVARVVPAAPVPQPDFLARAKAVWGEQPPGKPLSEVVAEARGGHGSGLVDPTRQG